MSGSGHQWSGNRVDERNVERVAVELCCEVCGKVCHSKGGLTRHRRMMQEESSLKRRFGCERCGRELASEANLKNHLKVCRGAEGGERKMCGFCGKEVSRSYFKRHRSAGAAKRGIDLPNSPPPAAPAPRIYVGKRKDCPLCGQNVAATNWRRHTATESCRSNRRP